MSKYYKIPLTERVVGTSTGSLYKMLRDNCPELYSREIGRMDLKYGDKKNMVDESIIADYNKETSRMYETLRMPEFIIAIEKVPGAGIEEISTSTPLIVSSKEFLRTRMVTKEIATSYIDAKDEYSEKIANFFSITKQKELVKKAEQQ